MIGKMSLRLKNFHVKISVHVLLKCKPSFVRSINAQNLFLIFHKDSYYGSYYSYSTRNEMKNRSFFLNSCHILGVLIEKYAWDCCQRKKITFIVKLNKNTLEIYCWLEINLLNRVTDVFE